MGNFVDTSLIVRCVMHTIVLRTSNDVMCGACEGTCVFHVDGSCCGNSVDTHLAL